MFGGAEDKLATEEAALNSILALQNFSQLQLVFLEYEKVVVGIIIKLHSLNTSVDQTGNGEGY